MNRLILGVLLSCVIVAPVAAQQTMPPPHAAPRVPVNREALAGHTAAPLRDVTGQALVLDGDKLRVGDSELRLFGVVPPQLSASFGPQARAALDAAVGGQSVTCHMRDRDHDGRLLATCQTAGGIDPALDMIKRGLAVAARGSIADTELAQPYVAAEQAAQTAKIGLWSMTVAPPVVVPNTPVNVAEASKPEAPKVEAAKTDSVTSKSTDMQPRASSAVMVPVNPVADSAAQDEIDNTAATPGFFARFQILIAGFLILATTLSIVGTILLHRRTEKREEMRALAAALRGELLAARAVCLTRVKSIVTEADDAAASWPRIRATLYQAYVGRLGWLGAELARQIASIYGQASDYASYYTSLNDGDVAATPKRQALQALASHIDEVLPRLAAIEISGDRTLTPNVPVTSYTMPTVPEPRTVLPKPVAAQPQITHKPEKKKPQAFASAPAPATTVSTVTTTTTSTATSDERIEEKLFRAVRQIRERFVEVHTASSTLDEPLADYTSLIEEDIERYSFSGDDDSDLEPFSKLSRH